MSPSTISKYIVNKYNYMRLFPLQLKESTAIKKKPVAKVEMSFGFQSLESSLQILAVVGLPNGQIKWPKLVCLPT